MKSLIRYVGGKVIPRPYRAGIRRWVLSLFGIESEPPSGQFGAVYCGNNRILAFHPKAGFMYVDGADASITPRVVTRNYEYHVTKALEALVRPGFNVVECGANQGYHTLSLAAMVQPGGRVLAFEPDPRNLAVLRDNIRSHYLDPTVTVIPKAAGNHDGPLSFYCARSGGQSSLFPLQTDVGPWASCYGPEEESRIEVMGTTISSVLGEYGLVPDLVRLDVEGAEPAALEGMWDYLERLPDIIVMFEYNPWCIKQGKQTTPEAFLERLRSISMRFWRIAGDGTFVLTELQEILTIPDFVIVEDFVACKNPDLLHRP
jgi:FkbM family methyltransferase